MIYPFDASYAQKVLRIHYEYAEVIVRKRGRLAAKTAGLIAHDRMLMTSENDIANAGSRRELSLNTQRIEARAA
ncbi:hypothetical protein VZC42_17165 [Raoultella ornithinolytica]|uniref:hypothetical protein n=1 Tax=Raoultella ornithinolytica TaxID=54291 RepID=UPI0038A31BB1